MTIIRGAGNGNPYFKACNEPFNNPSLSFEARGLLAYLLSKPADWEPTTKNLLSQHKGTGKKKMQRMINELKEHGYMRRERVNVDGGLAWRTTVTDAPHMGPSTITPSGVHQEAATRRDAPLRGSSLMHPLEDHPQKGAYINKRKETNKEIILLETQDPKESDPVVELGNEFSARTGIFPNHHSWNDSWEPVLGFMLQEAGSLENAIAVLDVALQKQRDARTKDGRPYTLASPKSIQSFARQALTETNDMDDGPEQWELLCRTVTTWGSARAKDHLPTPTFTAFKAYAYAWSTMSQQQLDSQIRQPFLEKLREVRNHAAAIH